MSGSLSPLMHRRDFFIAGSPGCSLRLYLRSIFDGVILSSFPSFFNLAVNAKDSSTDNALTAPLPAILSHSTCQPFSSLLTLQVDLIVLGFSCSHTWRSRGSCSSLFQLAFLRSRTRWLLSTIWCLSLSRPCSSKCLPLLSAFYQLLHWDGDVPALLRMEHCLPLMMPYQHLPFRVNLPVVFSWLQPHLCLQHLHSLGVGSSGLIWRLLATLTSASGSSAAPSRLLLSSLLSSSASISSTPSSSLALSGTSAAEKIEGS